MGENKVPEEPVTSSEDEEMSGEEEEDDSVEQSNDEDGDQVSISFVVYVDQWFSTVLPYLMNILGAPRLRTSDVNHFIITVICSQ